MACVPRQIPPFGFSNGYRTLTSYRLSISTNQTQKFISRWEGNQAAATIDRFFSKPITMNKRFITEVDARLVNQRASEPFATYVWVLAFDITYLLTRSYPNNR